MPTTTDGHTDRERVEELRDALRQTAAAFCGTVADLEPLADRLVHLDACLLAVERRAGVAYRGPGVRALAVDVVCGRLRALRPDLPYVSRIAAERGAEYLQSRGR